MDATDLDPIQSSADVKEDSYCVQETLVFNNENKPCFLSLSVLDRIRAPLRDLIWSDPSWYGYSIRPILVPIAEANWIG